MIDEAETRQSGGLVPGAPGNVWVLRCPTCGHIEDRWPKSAPDQLKPRACCIDRDYYGGKLPTWNERGGADLEYVEMVPLEISAGEIAERTRRRSERLAET